MKKQGFIIGPFSRPNEIQSDVFKNHETFVTNLAKTYKNKILFNKADENFKKKLREASLINRIKEEINCSDIIIADISGDRPNVLYELGLAHYLKSNKTVIVTQDKNNIPSDLTSFPCYDYTEAADINKLHDEIDSKIQLPIEIELNVGISEYPELMLIYYGIEKQYFKGIKIIPHIIKWNNLIDALNRDQVDVIISNKELINKKNDIDFQYIYHKDLFIYSSFYLISRNNSILKSFVQIKEEQSEKKDIEILFETLSQFNNGHEIKIMAARETDHYGTFEKLNSYFGSNLIEKTLIIGDDSPQELLNDFLDGQGDIYVGGIPERISLLKNPDQFKIIIDCNDLKRIVKDFKQKNVTIYKKEKIKKHIRFEEDIIRIFDLGWRKVFRDLKNLAIESNELEIKKYISTYNSIAEDNLKINVSDFLSQYIKSNELIKF